jgi:signal transduction histidine kinase
MVMAAGRRKSRRQRLFVCQAALILLPVMVLVLVGLSFLRQDRLLARREAEQRAQEIADELLPKCLAALVDTNDLALKPPVLLRVSPDGALVSPPAIPVARPKLLDMSQLNAQQLGWWRQMQGLDEGGESLDEQIEAAREIIKSDLPDSLMPTALFWLGSLQQKRGNAAEAEHNYERLARQFTEATGETGLPLAPLAKLKMVGLAESSTSQGVSAWMTAFDLCSNIVTRPSQISEPILEAVARMAAAAPENSIVEVWRAQWERDQGARQLYAALRDSLRATNIGTACWFHLDEPLPGAPNSAGNWFAFRPELAPRRSSGRRGEASANFGVLTPLASGAEPEILQTRRALNSPSETNGIAASSPVQTNVLLFAYNELELILREVASVVPGSVPPYLGVTVELAGRNVAVPRWLPDRHLWREVGYIGRNGGGVKKEVLPELATELLASAGGDFLHVNVYLTSPSDLFKRQRTRTFWLSSVIATSFLAAIAGLLAAWRSFSRQEQLAEMKTNFVSSVSHELRAPIASVRLLAESLERGNVSTPDKQTQYYHFIGQECRRLSSLIENVLDFSRIEQGRKQYEFEPTDLLALVRQTVALMNPYARERDVSLVCDVDGSVHERLEMSIDGQAIQQALINLIDNALKHSTKGQEVKVGLAVGSNTGKTNEDERSTIDIYVEDQGAGIPEAEHEKIFERFYRLGSELRRETQGIGIGLSIVKHIVEGHDGRVIVRSSPGTGSRFTIELPLVELRDVKEHR